ncbi:hypothetical protein K440DRAFT_359041 [Wilcoxina mikolae CBS 423.85]|nr:hypothetical protein K440DRAFT_359041 [Wilcoxina mikolae CBS 423.85]
MTTICAIQPVLVSAHKVTTPPTTRPATAASKVSASGSTPPSPQRSINENAIGRVMSHGRGGAGNIGPDPDGYKEKAEDLKISPVKSPAFTSTGRGGSGNMVYSDPNNPQVVQDLDGIPPKLSSGDYHGGRGGAGNVGHEPDPYAESAHTEAAVAGEKRKLPHEGVHEHTHSTRCQLQLPAERGELVDGSGFSFRDSRSA